MLSITGLAEHPLSGSITVGYAWDADGTVEEVLLLVNDHQRASTFRAHPRQLTLDTTYLHDGPCVLTLRARVRTGRRDVQWRETSRDIRIANYIAPAEPVVVGPGEPTIELVYPSDTGVAFTDAIVILVHPARYTRPLTDTGAAFHDSLNVSGSHTHTYSLTDTGATLTETLVVRGTAHYTQPLTDTAIVAFTDTIVVHSPGVRPLTDTGAATTADSITRTALRTRTLLDTGTSVNATLTRTSFYTRALADTGYTFNATLARTAFRTRGATDTGATVVGDSITTHAFVNQTRTLSDSGVIFDDSLATHIVGTLQSRPITDIGVPRVLGILPLSDDGLTGALGSNWSGAAYGLTYGGTIKNSGFTSADEWSNAGAAYTASAITTSDWEVTATVGGTDYHDTPSAGAWGDGHEFRLEFTDDTSGTNGYELRCVNHISGSYSDMILYRRASGVRTEAHWGFGSLLTAGDIYCLRKVGSNLSVWCKPLAGSWTQLYVYTDPSPHNTGGYGGLWIMDQHHRIDDFGVGSVTITETFPATSVLDTFNRADENPLAGGWGNVVFSGNSKHRIVSNKCQSQASVGTTQVWDTAPAADQEAYVTNTDGTRVELMLRVTNENTGNITCYFVIFYGSANNEVDIYKVINNSFTALATPTCLVSSAAGDIVGVRVAGTTLTIWQNGALRYTLTDSAVTGVGKLALSIHSPLFNVDSFGGGTYTIVSPRTQTGVSDSFARGTPSGRNIQYVNDLVLQGLTFRNVTDRWALLVANCQNVTILDCDFDSCWSGIRIDSCSGTLRIERCRFHAMTATSYASAIQVAFSTMEGRIRDCETDGGAGTEDQISFYNAYGIGASRPLVIEDCRLSNGVFLSQSNAGIDVGDGTNGALGSQYVRVHRNMVVTAGQVGIGVAGGRDIYVEDNLVYGDLSGQVPPWGAQFDHGLIVANWTETTSPGPIHVRRNRVYWRRASGAEADYLDGVDVSSTDWPWWSLAMGTIDLAANTMPDTSLAPDPLLPRIPLVADSIQRTKTP